MVRTTVSQNNRNFLLPCKRNAKAGHSRFTKTRTYNQIVLAEREITDSGHAILRQCLPHSLSSVVLKLYWNIGEHPAITIEDLDRQRTDGFRVKAGGQYSNQKGCRR